MYINCPPSSKSFSGRSIRCELFGEESLEVATTDLSLGQTERLLISYDKSYLHFYLSFHTRAIILGPNHLDTIRAYRLLSDIRYAYSDRLLTSIELLDRIDELTWFYLGDDESDLFSVVSSLLTHLYAARATALQNGSTMHYKGGIESAGGNTGTMLGDCIVIRESLLESLIRESVTQRIQSVIAMNTVSPLANFIPEAGVPSERAVSEWNSRLSQRGRPPPPPRSKYLSCPFNSLVNVDAITKEIIAWLLNDSEPKLRRGKAQDNRFGSGKPSLPEMPLALPPNQINFYEQKRMAKLKADEGKDKPLGVKQKTKVLVEKKLEAILSVVGPDEEMKFPTPVQSPMRVVEFPPPKTPPPPLKVPIKGSAGMSIKSRSIDKPSPLPRLPKEEEKNAHKPIPEKNISKTPDTKSSTPTLATKSATPESAKKPSGKEPASHSKLATNRNKAFLAIDNDDTSPKPRSKGQEEENKLIRMMPKLGDREVLLTKDLDGKNVSIRPVTGKDILQGLKLKIFAAGIFPYLLLTDLEEVERAKREVFIFIASHLSFFLDSIATANDCTKECEIPS